MNILIGADLVPTKSNIDLFASGDVQELLGEKLLNVLQVADYRVFNLEVPLTDQEHPISKCGPNLIAPTRCVSGYKALHVDLLTLANNHILDQDRQGLESTCRVLETAGIAYTGVGNTPEEAAKPYIFDCDGKRIGIYACAEHEFSIVTEHSAGANPIDLLESPDHVAALKAQCDFVIVLYHGGKEHYRYPSPNLQKVCRKLVEKGADLVICQHSHCIGCEEKYQGGTIVYGQGNFLFDASENELWQTSLLVQISNNFEIHFIPVKKQGSKVRLAHDEEAVQILDGFNKRSEEIKECGFVNTKYASTAKEQYYSYFSNVFSKTTRKIWFLALYKFTKGIFAKWYIRKNANRITRLAMENYLDCEAHREMFLQGLKEERG